jgi:methyltransferase (TIGR00027 family)
VAASRTAEYVALYRALETSERRRAPLFSDPLAVRFLTGSRAAALRIANLPGCRAMLERYADSRAPGARTSAIGRTRFIDDIVRDELGRGTTQLVILGAGYDTRAHRMHELAAATIYEVDRPETQTEKRRRIGIGNVRGSACHGPEVRDVRYVAVNFERDDLSSALDHADFARDRPALFLWEGVTNYLDEAAVAAVLAMVGRAAKGSAIVFTYIHRGVLDGSRHFEGASVLVDSVRKLGEPWRFGLVPSELGDFLGRHGLALEQDLGADEYRARYNVGARGYAFYRVAVARVA